MENNSLEEALNHEEIRILQKWDFMWYYANFGLYYEQVKSYIENFDSVKICFYDDLKHDPLTFIRELYDFLGVDSEYQPKIDVKYNISGIPKIKLLNKMLYGSNIFKKMSKPIVDRFINEEKRKEMILKIKAKNLKTKPKMPLETHKYLKELYYQDILKLEKLVNRDLSRWLE